MSDLYKLEIKDAVGIWIEVHLYAFGQYRVMVTDGHTTATQFWSYISETARAVATQLQRSLKGVQGIVDAEHRVDEFIRKKRWKSDGRVRLDQQGGSDGME